MGRGPFLPPFLGPGPALACPHLWASPFLGVYSSCMTRTDCASPQSPKGFLESYEEMLNYALRPETWATTRLELEGRGVSLLVLST